MMQSSDLNKIFSVLLQAGIAAAPARAVSAVKNMNIPQQIKDMKLPDLPQAIKDLKFWPRGDQGISSWHGSRSGHGTTADEGEEMVLSRHVQYT